MDHHGDTLHVSGLDAGPTDDNLVLRAIAAGREAIGAGPGRPPTPSLAARLEAVLLVTDEPVPAVTLAAVVEHPLPDVEAALHVVAGVAVLLITHNSYHAMAIGDRFTVLIGGQAVANFRESSSGAVRRKRCAKPSPMPTREASSVPDRGMVVRW